MAKAGIPRLLLVICICVSALVRVSGLRLFRIVGETGKNGQYTDYQFAANESLTDAPASGWKDAPPVVSSGQYLWMRSGVVIPPATET